MQIVKIVPYTAIQLLNGSTATRFIGPGQPHEGDLTYWKLYCTLLRKQHGVFLLHSYLRLHFSSFSGSSRTKISLLPTVSN